MEKKTKIILISSGVVITGLLLISKWSKNKSVNETGESSNSFSFFENIKNAVSPKKTLSPVKSFPLKKGITGQEVKTLQEWLNKAGYASPILDTDGIFGKNTENAVVTMQKTPNYTVITDYQKNELFTDPTISGEISKKFYDYFVGQTKTYVKTQTYTNPFLK